MEALTFEQLPIAVTLLTKEVSELKALLLKNSEQQLNHSTGRIFNYIVQQIFKRKNSCNEAQTFIFFQNRTK